MTLSSEDSSSGRAREKPERVKGTPSLAVGEVKQGSIPSERVLFDNVNLAITSDSSSEEIESRVSVPLVDAGLASIRVTLESPTRIAQEGREDYNMTVESDLEVIRTSSTPTGPAQLVSLDGLSWEIPVDYTGARTVLLAHEPKVKDFVMKHFLPGRVFVDVGANLGAYSVRASAWEMKVYSFEPNPENVKAFRRNLEINHLSVDILGCALGSSEGVANLSPNGAISRLTSESGVKVPVHTLDSFELPRIDLLKVDVEGYELEVFQGAIKTLERCHPAIVVEMHHWIGAEKEAALFNLLSGLNYRFEYLDRNNLGRHLAATIAPSIAPPSQPKIAPA